MPTLRNALIVGLASEQRGREVADVMQHLTGTTNGITVGASTGVLGFYGATPVVKQQCTTGTATAIIAALASIGLVNSTIG